MLRVPIQDNRDDAAIVKEVAKQVANIYMSADALSGSERRDRIVSELRNCEARWQ